MVDRSPTSEESLFSDQFDQQNELARLAAAQAVTVQKTDERPARRFQPSLAHVFPISRVPSSRDFAHRAPAAQTLTDRLRQTVSSVCRNPEAVKGPHLNNPRPDHQWRRQSKCQHFGPAEKQAVENDDNKRSERRQAQSILVMEGEDLENMNTAVRKVSYINSRQFPTPGIRRLHISTTVQYEKC
ncbi:calsyntenin-2 [Lates japonicus]|uniref:Calsyntenin-2 n=1 Tax=Lates japonicus TaxID=270547 RepID=A0AAD3MRP8_LATJO|nr:calsyntenin-2 [Lates japonicus]